MILDASANVRNFGAAGDAVTDDTAAFQAFLDAGGGFVPPGVYNIAGTLKCASCRFYSSGVWIKSDDAKAAPES